jgi:hypothetical protein
MHIKIGAFAESVTDKKMISAWAMDQAILKQSQTRLQDRWSPG